MHALKNLNSYDLFYKTLPIRHPILAKIQAAKQSISTFFPSRTFHFLSILKKTTCILHHFAFLFWLPARIF